MSNYNTLKTADTINAISIVDGAITTSKLNASVTTLIASGSGPKVAAITYPGNDLAADPAGGQTITLTGTGFVSGCSVFVGTTQASVVTVVSATSVTFTAPALAAATYTLYLVNPDGGTATIVPGISYSGTPIWSTTAGTLGSVYEYSPISNATTATGDGSISYSVFSGTLPTGSSLNTSTGVITGTSPASAGATTYTFVIRATDAQLQDSDRTFSITVNTDVVTWTSPAAASTVSLNKDLDSTTALLATSAANKAITYTATALPAGLSISGATVTGAPTVLGTTAVTFTATAATTGKTATAVINWTVSVASDTYFPYTTLLLSGAAATETFIADASVNNFALTIVGDTKPDNFNPYTPGYYSNYFNGNSDSLTVATNAAFAFPGEFTVEGWFNWSTLPAAGQAIGVLAAGGFNFTYGSGSVSFNNYGSGSIATATYTFVVGVWYHIAMTRNVSNTCTIWINGVSIATANSAASFAQGTWTVYGGSNNGGAGYVNNLRVVKGVAVYTAAFTVPTAPLTAIANTSLLTCQSNRFVDNSTNAFTIAVTGNSTVNPNNPFVPNTQYATYGSTYFDGTGDYLTVPANAAFAFGTGDFTIEAWIYRTALVSNSFIMSSSGSGGLFWGWDGSGLMGWGRTGVAWDYVVSSGMVANTWYHVALTRSGTSMKMFVNGTQLGVTQNIATSYDISTTTLNIGSQGANYYFTGYISNARIVKSVAVYTGTFTPPVAPLSATQSETSLSTPPTVEYLVVAGGGGAGGSSGGGGGAGGYRTASGFAVAANTAITVTVGAGGSGGAANTKGSAGLNSVFSTITATGGGAGGTGYSGGDMNGGNGGSGGGAGYYGDGTFGTPIGGISSPVTSPVQGYAGGAADPSNNIGGGGGGAGAVGSGGSGTTGAGGIGVQSSITGAATYYAGGGAGWSRNTASLGGLGGGGNESTAGTANTGGGGGGDANYLLAGFAGGSGVVVIRYADTYVAATCTGSPEITIAGGYRIYKFVTSGTMYITFNTETKAAITGSATSLLTLQTNQPASNSMFLDSSTNAFPVTRAGNTSAGTFTPYGANWSNYFGMKTDYISIPATAPLTTFTGDFTFECWVNPTDTSISTNWGIWDSRQNGSTANAMIFTLANLASPVTGRWRLSYYYGSGTQTYGTGIVLANQWTHVAFVRSGSTLTYYVNGVAGGTASVTGTQTGNSSSVVYIGSKDGSLGGYGTVGYISNFRIVNGTAVYTGNFAIPTAPLTAIAKTSLLTCQSNRSVDNSANAFVVTLGSATVSAQRFSPFAPQTQTAITHSAYFDGTGDYLTAPSNAAFGFGTGDFTIEAWIYRTDTGVQRGIVDSQAGAGGRILFYLTANNLLNLFDGTSVWLSSAITVPANQWVHVAAVRISGTTKLYINGAQQASGSDSRSYSAAVTYIGRQYGTTTNDFMGYISNARIVKGVGVYTAAFTVPTTPLLATQSSGTNIAAITGTQTSLLTCQSPTFIDNSTNAFAITAFGEAKSRTYNPFGFTDASAAYSAATYGGSAYFDTSGDYIAVTGAGSWVNFGTNDFTIECWCYHTNGISFFDTCPSGNPTPTNRIQLQVSGGGTVTYTTYQGTTTLITSSSGVALPNQWVHLALVKYSNQTKLYVNGTQVGSTYSDTLNYPAQTNRPILNGNGYDNSAGTSVGYISDMRIVKGTAVYKANFVAPAAPVTAITNTSLLLNMTSSGVYDSASTNNLETVGDAKRVATQTPYAGSFYSNYFNGTTDYLTTVATGLVPATNPFTIECWVYSTSYGDRGIVAQSAGGAGRLIISINSSGNVNFQIGGTTLTTTGYTIGLDQWTHIALTRVESTVTVYFNGVSVATGTNATAVDNVLVTIGRVPGYSQYWSGNISNLRIVNGVAVYTGNFAVPTAPLTATQAGNGATISAISGTATSLLTCQSNRFLDNSTNLFAITRSGNVAVQSFNPFQRNSAATLYFDGTGDYLVAPYNPAYNFGTGNFTIEFWVNTTSTAAYATALRLGNTWTTGSWSFYLNDVNGSGVPSWWSFTLNTTLSTSGVTINDGAWHHIALVRNSTTMTMYIDGTSRGTLAVSTSSVGDTTTQLWIARDASNVRELAGYINDLRITKGVARYTSTFTPPTTAFITK